MQELLIVRHAIAQGHGESTSQGLEDAVRPLTEGGIERMALAAQGLHRLVTSLDVIYASPLLRARQTAQILTAHYPKAQIREGNWLVPEYDTGRLADAVGELEERRLAIVGHEPGLGQLIATLVCGEYRHGITLKKGGAALLRFEDRIAPTEGRLLWLATPKQLRLLGRGA